ncbi:MAG: hypothetical protein C0630_01515 [Sedimenticola selenatireducens]|uniref:Uncharacterized protein n=1 Tax=Sedimenticola selenatireducens TaxID=191960 RepID=A0A2N6D1P0_9GAMM|nr:MAG: hypothetical protein C0630_01515 [Sedimenticola selenatireducens]
MARPAVMAPVLSAWAILTIQAVMPSPVVGMPVSMPDDFFLAVSKTVITMGIPTNLPLLVLAILIFHEATSVVSASCLDLRHDCK